MHTIDRLQTYYTFDEDVIAAVAGVADRQLTMGWMDYLVDCGVADPEIAVFGDKATEFIEFRPSGNFDETRARVFHNPMANSLDPNMAYQAATIYAVDPTSRLFAVANPGCLSRNAGALTGRSCSQVSQGDLRPVVEPTLRLLEQRGITSVQHIGVSYGAEKSVTAAGCASQYNHKVEGIVAIDPPSVKDRSFRELAAAFASTNKRLEAYAAASDSPAFAAARCESVGLIGYSLGLVRLSNIAITMALTKGRFESRADAALVEQPGAHCSIAWGSESELSVDGLMGCIVDRLQQKHGVTRVQPMRLPGQYHALGYDIHLQAALAAQGLKHQLLP